MRELLILAGPSAVGKTTVMSELLRLSTDFSPSRSVTTRNVRDDKFNSEYEYLTPEEFKKRIPELLEYTDYETHSYGTPRSEIERIFGEGRTPLLVLDLNGVVSLAGNEDDISVFCAYIWDDLEVMSDRLKKRMSAYTDKESAEKMYGRRMNANVEDYMRLPQISSCLGMLIKNTGTPTDTATEIIAAFAAFKRGEPTPLEEISDTAEMLAASAVEFKNKSE